MEDAHGVLGGVGVLGLCHQLHRLAAQQTQYTAVQALAKAVQLITQAVQHTYVASG